MEVIFVLPGVGGKVGEEKSVDGQVGQTLLDLMQDNDIPVINICGGAGVCGSCRVKIAPGSENRVLPPEDRELDVLEMLQMDDGVRLACQIKLTEECDGLRVLPVDYQLA
jgi:ferredoxin